MKFSAAFTVALLSLAKFIAADSESFGLVSLRSGSPLQFSGVYAKDGALYLGSNQNYSGVVTDDGKLKFSDNSYAVAGDDGYLTTTTDASKATTGFAVKNGYLQLNNSEAFYGVQSGSDYKVAVKSEGSNSQSVSLSARSTNGQTVPDFTPGSSGSSSSSAAPASSSAAPASSSEAAKTSAAPVSQIGDGQIQATTATPKPTAQPVSQIGDGQIQATTGTQSVLVKTDVGNNAGKVTLGSSAAVAALAALLL
ncbi:cell wall protein CWP1 [Kluyveromyces marxianus]|uniref:Cell wall protein CWP1 n=1 Tax=Kluyveromyces marxianus TaxID=4911 RepID=A0ABX6F0B0_KLUMA|nr:cell wall protein CWP1 [Kluyveromyces marxianus]